jgi:hypothetical protein
MFEFIMFYVLPAIISYFGIRNDYKQNKFLSPDFADILFVIAPFINIAVALSYILDFIYDKLCKKINVKKITRKFFRL